MVKATRFKCMAYDFAPNACDSSVLKANFDNKNSINPTWATANIIVVMICLRLKWPTSCANTATSSSMLWLLIKVSYNTIFFFLPIPEKKAFALLERFEPSITYILSKGKSIFWL